MIRWRRDERREREGPRRRHSHMPPPPAHATSTSPLSFIFAFRYFSLLERRLEGRQLSLEAVSWPASSQVETTTDRDHCHAIYQATVTTD